MSSKSITKKQLAYSILGWSVKDALSNKDINSLSDRQLIDYLDHNVYEFSRIENPSEEVKLFVVKKRGELIHYIKNPSNELQIAAVEESSYAILDIKNPIEAAILYAIKRNPNLFLKLKGPFSEKVQLEAVNYCGLYLEHIIKANKVVSKKVEYAAVKQNGMAIQWVKNPSEKMKLLAVSVCGEALKYIKNPSNKIIFTAINSDGAVISQINNPSEKLQLLALERSYNAHAFNYIKNPTEKVIMKLFELGKIDRIDHEVLLKQKKAFLEKLNNLKVMKDIL